MALRITDPSLLPDMSDAVRRQLEQAFGHDLPQLPGRDGGKRKIQRPEQDAGAALVRWIDLYRVPRDIVLTHGEILPAGTRIGPYFAHVPNGGFRDPVEAAIFQGQGVRRSWPDYVLDLPVGGFHGLRLELKAENGEKPGPDQLDTLLRLERVGYRCVVAWGFDQARDAIISYVERGR